MNTGSLGPEGGERKVGMCGEWRWERGGRSWEERGMAYWAGSGLWGGLCLERDGEERTLAFIGIWLSWGVGLWGETEDRAPGPVVPRVRWGNIIQT